jgi:hypothetical protein
VSGYLRSDGTYVAPHHRSAPDSSTLNNWSTAGNANPYTGAVGTNSPGSGFASGASTLLGAPSYRIPNFKPARRRKPWWKIW